MKTKKIAPLFIDPIPAPEDNTRPNDWAHQPETIKLHLGALKYLVGETFPAPAAVGDGLVYVGGGPYWPGIVVGIRMLRSSGSKLPVQIWHRGVAEPVNEKQLEGLGPVEIIDMEAHGKRTGARILRGWEAKLYALAHCGFRRVLFLDADAYVVDNPAPLFEELEKAPFVFWSDMPHNYTTLKFEQVWPEGDNGVPAVQGGQLIIDRARAWKLILLAHWCCQHSDFYFSHMFGDQDTWRLVLAALKGEVGSLCLGAAPWSYTAFVCPAPDGRRMIVHRCQGKLFRIWDIPGGGNTYNSPQYGLPKEEEVFFHLSEVLHQEERSAEETFSEIYRKKLWGIGSGNGSQPAEAAPFVNLINFLIRWKGIKSVVDLGCGDGNVGRSIEVESYAGVDCCSSLLSADSESYSRVYFHLDLIQDKDSLPNGELAILKDVLHHWPTQKIADWLEWAERCGKWRYLILVYDRAQVSPEADCHLGGYRALNHKMWPLNCFQLTPVTEYLHKEITLLELPLS